MSTSHKPRWSMYMSDSSARSGTAKRKPLCSFFFFSAYQRLGQNGPRPRKGTCELTHGPLRTMSGVGP
eukprot:3143499-Pyramimonas_sp.AAC.1